MVTEALDRLSRSQGDVATPFEDLQFMGVAIRTISEGEIEEMAVGLKGTMNALFLRETGRKTKRGIVGVAQKRRHVGGRVYGYRVKRELDQKGEYVAGLREVDPVEAEVVREIFMRYAAGFSPRAIVADLNARGLPSRRGGQWNALTINGNAARGNGALHNQLYRGRLVWGRHRWTKSRETGARRARTDEAADIVTTQVSHVRVVSEELWEKVEGCHALVTFWSQKRPEQSGRLKASKRARAVRLLRRPNDRRGRHGTAGLLLSPQTRPGDLRRRPHRPCRYHRGAGPGRGPGHVARTCGRRGRATGTSGQEERTQSPSACREGAG